MARIFKRFSSMFHRENDERDLALELDSHLQMLTDQHVRAGASPLEAARLARLQLGGVECVKENCRDARRLPWLEDLWHDLIYSFRSLRERPGFATIALLTLGLGTGATTVMFAVVNSVLLRPLPYPDQDRLLVVHSRTERLADTYGLAYPDYQDLKDRSKSLGPIAAWGYGSNGTITAPGNAEYVTGRLASADLFSVLKTPPLTGRPFLAAEDRAGGPAVVMISHRLWQQRFGGSQQAIGAQLVMEDKPYIVVGVMPPGFQLGGPVDVLTPFGQYSPPRLRNRDLFIAQVLGRLSPGADFRQAQTEISGIGHQLAVQYPENNRGRSFDLHPLAQDMVSDTRPMLLILLAAVGSVLLIACVNVASLLLARSVSRERELAMRVALGAGRFRLVRQCITESAVLGVSGAMLGVLIAMAGTKPFVGLWPEGLPRAEEVRLDWRVLVFALGLALLCSLFFGIAPALRTPLQRLEGKLRAGARSISGGTRRLHGGFVGAQIAIAVVLLVCAGILGRTLLHFSGVNPGFNPHNVLTARVRLSPQILKTAPRARAFWRDFLGSVEAMPGVRSAAIVDIIPMREGVNELGYWTNAAVPPVSEQPVATAHCATNDYLKTMGVSLKRGRFFTDNDRIDSPPVVVIDEVMAAHAFKGEDPVGKRLWIPYMDTRPVTVVGVVGHVRQWGLAGDDTAMVRDQFYYPFSQVPDALMPFFSGLMSIAVRTASDPQGFEVPLRRQLQRTGSDQVLYEVFTMDQLTSASLSRQRFLMVLFGVFAALALVLASVGIYGVLAYLASQRVPEIGVRMALGASAQTVLRMVMRQSLTMILAGIAIGIAGALGAGRVLVRLVAGASGMDVITIALMTSLLVIAALGASFVPARRASRVDPMRALRQE